MPYSLLYDFVKYIIYPVNYWHNNLNSHIYGCVDLILR